VRGGDTVPDTKETPVPQLKWGVFFTACVVLFSRVMDTVSLKVGSVLHCLRSSFFSCHGHSFFSCHGHSFFSCHGHSFFSCHGHSFFSCHGHNFTLLALSFSVSRTIKPWPYKYKPSKCPLVQRSL